MDEKLTKKRPKFNSNSINETRILKCFLQGKSAKIGSKSEICFYKRHLTIFIQNVGIKVCSDF